MISDNTEDHAPKKGTDTLSQWFSKMYGTVKAGHRQDRILSPPSYKSKHKKPPEEELNGNKIASIGKLI